MHFSGHGRERGEGRADLNASLPRSDSHARAPPWAPEAPSVSLSCAQPPPPGWAASEPSTARTVSLFWGHRAAGPEVTAPGQGAPWEAAEVLLPGVPGQHHPQRPQPCPAGLTEPGNQIPRGGSLGAGRESQDARIRADPPAAVSPQPRPPWHLYPKGPLGRGAGAKRSTASSARGVGQERRLKRGADSVGAESNQAARGEPGQRQVPMAP